jgi:hypothetical protein
MVSVLTFLLLYFLKGSLGASLKLVFSFSKLLGSNFSTFFQIYGYLGWVQLNPVPWTHHTLLNVSECV